MNLEKSKMDPLKENCYQKFQRRMNSQYFSVFYCGSACCWQDVELLALFINDQSQINIEFVNNPEHADVLLIMGFINAKREKVIREIYEQIPDKKYVISAGSCALSKGLYSNSYVSSNVASKIIPVDVYVTGCPPTCLDILEGFKLLSQKIMQTKHEGGKAGIMSYKCC